MWCWLHALIDNLADIDPFAEIDPFADTDGSCDLTITKQTESPVPRGKPIFRLLYLWGGNFDDHAFSFCSLRH